MPRRADVARRQLAGLVLAIAAMAAVAAPTAAASPSLARGLYQGTVTDPDGDPDTYTAFIRITVAKLQVNKTAARIAYRVAANDEIPAAGLACRGRLSFRKRVGSRFTFREVINGGGGAECVSGGLVTLTRRSATTLSYTWTEADQDRPTPSATLARVR